MNIHKRIAKAAAILEDWQNNRSEESKAAQAAKPEQPPGVWTSFLARMDRDGIDDILLTEIRNTAVGFRYADNDEPGAMTQVFARIAREARSRWIALNKKSKQ